MNDNPVSSLSNKEKVIIEKEKTIGDLTSELAKLNAELASLKSQLASTNAGFGNSKKLLEKEIMVKPFTLVDILVNQLKILFLAIAR